MSERSSDPLNWMEVWQRGQQELMRQWSQLGTANGGANTANPFTAALDGAGRRCDLSGCKAQQRCLASPGRAEEEDPLAGRERDIEIAQDGAAREIEIC